MNDNRKTATKLYKSKFTVNASPVYISDNMSAKMSGIPAISTSVLCNENCQKRRAIPGSICEKCFAVNVTNRYSDLERHLEENTKLLTSRILKRSELPIFGNVRVVRFEAFGDLNNETQLINYANIAKVNPGVTFALWTKNFWIVKSVFDQVRKPKNLVVIQSAYMIDKPMKKANEYIDKVFTVYSKDYIKEHGIEINCGARSCASCMRCYSKRTGDDVREQLK